MWELSLGKPIVAMPSFLFDHNCQVRRTCNTKFDASLHSVSENARYSPLLFSFAMGMKSQVYHGKNYDKAIDDNV